MSKTDWTTKVSSRRAEKNSNWFDTKTLPQKAQDLIRKQITNHRSNNRVDWGEWSPQHFEAWTTNG